VVYDRESFEVSGKLFADIKSYIGDNEAMYELSYRSYMPIKTYGRNLQESSAERIPELNASEGSARRSFLDRILNRGRVDTEEARSTFPEFQEADAEEESVDYDLFSDEDTLDFPGSLSMPSYAPAFPTQEISLDERLKHLDKTFQEYLFMLIDRRGLTDPEVYKKANIDRKHFSKIRSNVDYSPSKKTALALAIALELSLDETKDLLARAGLALSPSMMSDRIIEYCIETSNYDIYEINCILFKYDQPTLGA
jgi:hypothetical protein